MTTLEITHPHTRTHKIKALIVERVYIYSQTSATLCSDAGVKSIAPVALIKVGYRKALIIIYLALNISIIVVVAAIIHILISHGGVRRLDSLWRHAISGVDTVGSSPSAPSPFIKIRYCNFLRVKWYYKAEGDNGKWEWLHVSG